jgi:flavodoxin
MKRLVLLAIALFCASILLFNCVGCPVSASASGSGQSGQSSDGEKKEEEKEQTGGEDSADEGAVRKILIAYFTMPKTDGVDTVAGASRVVKNGEVLGNVQFIAQTIQKAAGGDLFRIETVQPYPGVHDRLVDQAKTEQNEIARPRLARAANVAAYDVIFIGYPNWWGDLPMPLYTFLENTDLSGKTIVPFNVHGGSGFSNTISTIVRLQPRANVITDGWTVSRNTVGNAENDVRDWVKSLNFGQ